MPSLTDATIRAATPPAKGQKTLWDGLKGFGIRLSQGGSKTFIVMIGSGKRFTIGRYPAVSLAEARTEAKRILAEKQLGKLRPARVSFDQALKEYLADCEGRLRPRSLKNYRDYLTAYFRYSRRSLCDITTREIILSLKSLSPSQREHAMRIGRTFFTWCVRHSLLDQSPMQNMPPVPLGKPRTRVLSEDELRAVWRTACARTTPFHAIVALLLLTGQRRGEIAALQWDWIRDDRIEFPASVAKNHRAWTVPLGPEAQNLLGEHQQNGQLALCVSRPPATERAHDHDEWLEQGKGRASTASAAFPAGPCTTSGAPSPRTCNGSA